MRILLIENQPYASQITSKRNDITAYDGSLSQSVEVVAEDIKIRYGKLADVFIINTHLQIGNAPLSENAGIKLLKLLRLHYIDTHVVLYSWMSREMLMRDLRNAIIFSKGVSFCRLPDFLNVIQGINFTALSNEKAEKHELLQLFRAEYDPDDRHFDANMFGVWQLLKVQVAYEKAVPNTDAIEDIEVFRTINEYMDSYNGKLLQFINGWKDGDIIRDFFKAMHNGSCAALIEAEQQLKALDEEIAFKEEHMDMLATLIEDETNNVGVSQLSDLFGRKREVEGYIQELNYQRKEIERIQKQYDNIKPLRLVLDPNSDRGQDYRARIQKLGSSVSGGTVSRIFLAKRKPRIIYVDDMANKGWADVLQRIVYGGPDDNFVVVPVEGLSTDQIASDILAITKSNTVDLLIIDLRLKDERGYIEPSELSGFKVLNAINKSCPPFPILVFTASNKVWSLKEAFKGNVMSYWTKGGLEQNDEDSTFIKSYLELVDQIDWLTSIKWFVDLLANTQNTYNKIDSSAKNMYWWETRCITYKRGNLQFFRYFTSRTSILSILDNAVKTAQDYLRQMSFAEDRHKTEHLLVNSFVMYICDILEQIHHYKMKDKSFITLPVRMEANSKVHKLIQVTRNQAAHNAFLKSIERGDVIEFVKYVLDYLENIPPELSKYADAKTLEASNPNLTPISKRNTLLQQGKHIIVPVLGIDQDDKGYCYHFWSSALENWITGCIVVKERLTRNGVEVKVGDPIKVKKVVYPGTKKSYFKVED